MINVLERLEYPGAFQPRSGTASVGHHLNTTKFLGADTQTTILDKTVEKSVYLGNIFLNIVAVPVLPSPSSPESNVVYSKESLIPGCLGSNIELREENFFPQRRRFGNSFAA